MHGGLVHWGVIGGGLRYYVYWLQLYHKDLFPKLLRSSHKQILMKSVIAFFVSF